MKLATFLTITSLILIPATQIYGTIWSVPSPTCPTIQTGIDSASAGDTVLVACGTYNEYDITMKSGVHLLSSTGQYDCVTIDAQGNGRVIFCNGVDNTASIEGFTIMQGFTLYGGGGMRLQNNSSIIIKNCSISGNHASSQQGGGISINNSTPVITNCLIEGNTANSAAGIDCMESNATITDCIITGNTAIYSGGGFGLNQSDPDISRCTISNNYVADMGWGGGGLFVYDSHPTLTSCTITGNSGLNGGGLFLDHANPSIDSCTISHNTARTSAGGGIYCHTLAYPFFDNTIIAFSTNGEAFYCDGTCGPTFSCCNIYGNTGGDWIGCISGQASINNNMSQDPLFCNAGNEDFTVAAISPCLPNNNPCGTQIGAFGHGWCLCLPPIIAEISDVGNDQGRWVRIKWQRSLYDEPEDTVDITDYGIYRKQEQYLFAVDGGFAQAVTFLTKDKGPQLNGWDYLGMVPAHGDSIYQLVVPTLCDSTAQDSICWSTFFIRAMTPDPFEYFDSPPDSGYSVDNLAPSVPEGFSVAYNTGGGNYLTWEPCEDDDFQYFCIYRGSTPDFTPFPENLFHMTIEIEWLDPEGGGGMHHYKITAVDHAGNESDAASPGTTTAIQMPGIPRTFALHQNVPNPFNPTTTIEYNVPKGGAKVTLKIYDVSGQLVRTLIDSEETPGRKSAMWDGKDKNGQSVASGIYFYRLKAKGFAATRKMVLIK